MATLLASLTNFGGPDLIIILLIILVLFGAKRLPDLAKGMGQALREFHKAKDEFGQEMKASSGSDPASFRTPANAVPTATLADRAPLEPEIFPAQARSNAPRSASV